MAPIKRGPRPKEMIEDVIHNKIWLINYPTKNTPKNTITQLIKTKT